mmetsp:Transcript_12570/g.38390  ORF Transcript_12570/g.38390 Transcript_12570/m.38390 type:complete len:205 (-) Transcript_12570:793-1407(-)
MVIRCDADLQSRRESRSRQDAERSLGKCSGAALTFRCSSPMSLPQNGYCAPGSLPCTSSVCKSTPRDHTSAGAARCGAPAWHSGAMYAGVPWTDLVKVLAPSRAAPKSHNLAVPLAVITMFSSFMSRCAIFLPWRYPTPSTTWAKMRRASASESPWRLATYSPKLPPAAYSISSSVRPARWTARRGAMMLACSSFPASLASFCI